MSDVVPTLPDDLTNRVIADMELLRVIGRGSSGVVYLARQRRLDREVALKILLPEVAADPAFIRSFFREARLAAKLNHRNIVRALDVGTEDGLCYFAMEYVPGRTLEEIRLKSSELMTLPFLFNLAIQLANALDYAWSNFKLIHGDIKPENLLVRTRDNMLKLADLGLARIRGDSESEIIATPLYAAPEVIRGEHESSPASDIYSFGVMLYELVAGAAPFDPDEEVENLLRRHLDETPAPLIEANPDVSRELSDFVGRMLEKDPQKRPASWREISVFFQGQLRREETGIPPSSRGTVAGLPAAVRREASPTRTLLIAAAVALVVLLITVIVLGVLIAVRG